MLEPSFSAREGLRANKPLIFDDAPYSIRYGFLEVLQDIGFDTPKEQRSIICKAWRVPPDPDNWGDQNVDDEVARLLSQGLWYEFFDRIERLPKFLRPYEIAEYQQKVNDLLADESIGYHFHSGKILRVGTEEFAEAVEGARTALTDERFVEPRRQFERGLEFRNSRPPDWANAIKETTISAEAVLQVIYNRPGVSLTTIVGENLPSDLPTNIKKLFKSLYGQGSCSSHSMGREVVLPERDSEGPNQAPHVQNSRYHIAAALHAFAVAELDT